MYTEKYIFSVLFSFSKTKHMFFDIDVGIDEELYLNLEMPMVLFLDVLWDSQPFMSKGQ